MGVFFKLALNTINKSLRVSKILLEENLKLWPYNRSGALVAVLVLGLFEADNATEEIRGKQGTNYPCDTGCLKIIFILLTKMVAVYVRLSKIGLWGSGFIWALSRL